MQLNGSYGKEKSYVRDIFFGYDYYSFQNPRASNDDFFLNAFKTRLRLSRVVTKKMYSKRR